MDLSILKNFPLRRRGRGLSFVGKKPPPSPCRQGKAVLKPLEEWLSGLYDGMKLCSIFSTRKGGRVRKAESGGLPNQTSHAFGLTLFAGRRCERR
jgi:hypothetical protein